MKNLNKKTTTDGESRSVEELLKLELTEVFGRISTRKHQKNTLITLNVILKSFLNGDLYDRDISKILSKELLLENYDELTKQGISIDINKLMTVLVRKITRIFIMVRNSSPKMLPGSFSAVLHWIYYLVNF